MLRKKELERTLPFEKEVKEKNLLIGKLRHEGVILNDHLTKALRFIKQKNPEEDSWLTGKQCQSFCMPSDRASQVVTNHFLHFLTLDRSDPKKFQVLQLIAALLAWDDGMPSTLQSAIANSHRQARAGGTLQTRSSDHEGVVAARAADAVPQELGAVTRDGGRPDGAAGQQGEPGRALARLFGEGGGGRDRFFSAEA